MFSKGKRLPIILLVSIATLCITGCNKENDNIFTATTKSYDSHKLHFNGSNTTYWDDGNEVLINGNRYTISVDGNDNNKARIAAEGVTPYGGNFYAAYPAERATMSGNTTVFKLPYSEEYETVSSDNQLINNLMVAKSSDNTLAFENVAAMLHFRIKGSGNGEGKKLMAIEVSCDKPLVGNLTVNCDDLTTSFSGTATDTARMLTLTTPYTITADEKDFYILIPPVENASHFRVSYVIEDGNTVKVFEKTKVATISFTKNNIYHFGDDNYTGSKMYFQGNIEVSPLAMDGSASNPYLVSSETTWNLIKSNLGNANKYITLVNDITVATTVSSLKATLNGNGHTITLSNNKSLFQTIDGGVVRNLTMAGNITSPTCYSYKYGALACIASNNAVIENCVNKANITCMQGKQNSTNITMVGGICGQLGNGCSISNCRNEGDINSDARYIGGVVGFCNGVSKAQNCVNNNNLTITLAQNESNVVFIGGIFGQLTISSTSGEHAATECHNNGAITINGTTEKNINCGGCFGVITSSSAFTVNNCTNTAAIKYNTAASGSCYFGGIVGSGNNGTTTMLNCNNEGSITTVSGVHAGGILGYNKKISILNCYAYCNISATTSAGIVADGSSLVENTTISHCYYYGTITAQNVFGIAGHSNYSGGTNFNMTLDHCCYPVSITDICAATTNYDASSCITMSSASDNGALTLLNSNIPVGGKSWVINGGHITLSE